jgi:hypothetical protein
VPAAIPFAPGGYRYLPSVFQYSAGVATADGYRIERVRFRTPLALAEGFARIEAFLADIGRPTTAICAFELRSPAPMDEAGFRAFNELYVERLARWGLIADGRNPVARSNVCPKIAPPPAPSVHAFSFTMAEKGAGSFVISGSGEVPEGKNNYRDHIVRPGDVSAAGLREKARFVLDEMEVRLGGFGFTWQDTTATQVYTLHDIHPLLADEILARGAGRQGLTWHYCSPPIVGLDFEMDCRGVAREIVV